MNPETQFNQATFSLDGEGAFNGYHDISEHWNGWACPYFDRSTAVAVLEWLKESSPETWEYKHHESEDVFELIDIMDGDTEGIRYKGVEINGVTMYPIGSWYLCWTVEL